MSLLPEWREGAVISATGGGTSDVQTAVLHQVEAWFEEKKLALPRAEFCGLGFKSLGLGLWAGEVGAKSIPGLELGFGWLILTITPWVLK